MSIFVIDHAEFSDLTSIKRIADSNREALGFVPRPKVEEAIATNRVLVASDSDQRKVVAFVIYRHRKTDKQTTVYDICVEEEVRRQGIGSLLLKELYDECRNLGRDFIQLKCPLDLAANLFYKSVGFYRSRIEQGKRRSLNVWRLDVKGRENI